MNCAKCGTELPAGSVFCQNCGARATPPQVAASQCRVCQATLKPGALFCANCGSAVAAAATPLPSQQPQQPQQPAVPPQAWQQTNLPPNQQNAIRNYQQQYQQNWQQPVAPAPPKRKRKGLVVALVVVLVLVLAAGAVYALAGKQIRRLIMGPKATYLAIESKALKDDAADLVEDLVRIGNIQQQDEKGGTVLELAFELPGLASASSMDPAMIESLEKLSLDATYLYDRSESEPRYYTSLDLMTQGERLLTLDVYFENDRIVLGLPDVLDQYIFADSATLAGLTESMGTGIDMAESPTDLLNQMMSMDLGIDQAKMEKSMNRLIDIVMNHIDDAEFKGSQTMTAGSVSGRYDLYTITISSENMRLMFLDLFQEIRDDDEIFNLAAKIYNLYASADPEAAAMDGATLTRAVWEESLDELIVELEDELEPDEKFTLVQHLYVDGKDEIRGREITITDNTGTQTGYLKVMNPVDGDQEGFLMEYDADGETGQLTASYTVKDDRKTGTASLTVAGSEVAKATFSGLDAAVIDEKDYLLGEIEIEISDPSAGLPGNLIYKGSESGGKFTGELGIKDYAVAKIGYQEIPADSATIPEYNATNLVDANDQEALQGLMTEDVMNELTVIISKLGFPME